MLPCRKTAQKKPQRIGPRAGLAAGGVAAVETANRIFALHSFHPNVSETRTRKHVLQAVCVGERE
jgi:hypothetical protein